MDSETSTPTSDTTNTSQKQSEQLDELLNLDYALYDKVGKDFKEKMEERHPDYTDPERTVLAATEHYEDETLVLNVKAVRKPDDGKFYGNSMDEGKAQEIFQDVYSRPGLERNISEFEEEHENPSVEEEYVMELLHEFNDNPVHGKYTLEGISEAAGSQILQDLYTEPLEEIGEIYRVS